MQFLPANIYSIASVREIDRRAIEENDLSGYTLMQRAAAAAVQVARQQYPDAKRWQIICGPGNNGGDGYVVARLAAHDGIVASVVTLVDPDSLSGDAATAYQDFAAEGGIVMPWAGELDAEADLLVDALLGSGLQRDVSGDYAVAVRAINEHPGVVQALDIATGINGDTGAVMGSAVKANITTTFVGLKAGLFLGEGPNFCGEISFADLDIPDACHAGLAALFTRIDERLLRALLPPRPRAAHKGDFGHVLVIGGGPGMAGAARLCGEAALRGGAGRVSIATHPEHAALITASRPELMCHGVADADSLAVLMRKADVLAFGPGLGQSEWAEQLFRVVAESELPAVWDADGLNWLASAPNVVENRIITPHPGEAATLLSMSTSEIQSDRPSAVAALAERYGGIAVLKGAGTLVSSGDGLPFISTSGNPGMAAPGMGDVLTGVIAAFVSQGLSLQDAALAGVESHARAGDLAAAAGERGMLAGDLVDALRTVVNP
jgi:NAD(P)H-hydrate epimerase